MLNLSRSVYFARSPALPLSRSGVLSGFVLLLCVPALGQWRLLPAHDGRQTLPKEFPAGGQPIKPGDKLPDDKFHWLIGDLKIPDTAERKPTTGRAVGLHINCGDGGEIYVNREFQTRYDNDHPGLALVAERAVPGTAVQVVVQIYGKVQGGDSFSEGNWVLVDDARVRAKLQLEVASPGATKPLPVPNGIIGLSQGGGLSDYEDATAAKLKEGGFKWFRMDNILTQVLKKGEGDRYAYDWSDFDRRADFIVKKMDADAIFAVSYMPQVLDAVPDPERHSAPKDYLAWQELCYQAAKRCLDRGARVRFWEVWNEVNTGWLKPGPQDTGSEAYKALYTKALGREQTEAEVNRRFEAYCKLYQATAKGLLRADPHAKIGGPGLASGPFEHDGCGHCWHGQGFAKGLMLWCDQQNLPLDFVSWHEYFQAPEEMQKEVKAFREYLVDFPRLQRSVQSYMITEWNQAWWADRPQDHELGAAWCANGVTRAFIPGHIDRPCFFYVKQNDMNFRGDYSLLMGGNVPKPQYNVAKIFNELSGQWLVIKGNDGDVSGVACWDQRRKRVAVVLVNFSDRYGVRRHVHLAFRSLPADVRGGRWREWLVDGTHCNVWNNAGEAELRQYASGRITGGSFALDRTLAANSVTLIELVGSTEVR